MDKDGWMEKTVTLVWLMASRAEPTRDHLAAAAAAKGQALIDTFGFFPLRAASSCRSCCCCYCYMAPKRTEKEEEGAAAAAAVCQSLIDRTIESGARIRPSLCLCVCIDTVVRLASIDG